MDDRTFGVQCYEWANPSLGVTAEVIRGFVAWGSFDNAEPGHLTTFEEAQHYADILRGIYKQLGFRVKAVTR